MKIKFAPTGQEIEGDPNKTLLQLCVENNIEIKSICKGVPSCAECRVKIIQGEHNIVPPSKTEMSLIGTNYFIDQRRLSCQVHCYGDITVDLTEQIERSEIQNKKVRGFRAPGQKGSQVETHAKQGTLILEETGTPAPKTHPQGHHIEQNSGHPQDGQAHPQQTEGIDGRAQEPRQQQGRGGGGRGQGQGQNQKQGGGGNRNRQGGRNNRGGGGGGGNRGPNNPAQAQNRNQNQRPAQQNQQGKRPQGQQGQQQPRPQNQNQNQGSNQKPQGSQDN